MKIRVFKEFTDIIKLDELVLMVKEQMHHISTNRTVSEISMNLMTVLNSESSARLLALEVDDERLQQFYFANDFELEEIQLLVPNVKINNKDKRIQNN